MQVRKHIHFIGIGGVGMSGLACIDLARGMNVSGSDPQQNVATERLSAGGATVYSEQIAANISQERPDLVVCTAAIRDDNAELQAAKAAGIPIVSRAEYLGRLMSEHAGPRIAVTGTHGKTTTTAMIASVLMEGGLDPNVLVGAEYAGIGGNVRLGCGTAFLTEACEAYDSFLSLKPDIAVITNIEADHLDYYGTEDRLFESFETFVSGMPDSGILIACADDPGVQRLLAKIERSPERVVTYRIGPSKSQIVALEVEHTEPGKTYRIVRNLDAGSEILGTLALQVPGTHNVRNALAAIAAGLEVSISFDVIARALSAFSGSERRFELLAEVDGITVMDDYAHHPTEINATLSAACSAFPGRRLIVAFQPHLYSRTRDFLDEFAQELGEADVVVVSDIYAAREKPIEGIHASDVVRRLASAVPKKTVLYAGGVDDVPDKLLWVSRPGDVVFTMGAGDIRRAGEVFVERLKSGSSNRQGRKREEVAA